MNKKKKYPTLDRKQTNDIINEDKKKHPDKIYFAINYNFISMSFKHENIQFINSFFENSNNNELKCYEGRVFKLIDKDVYYDDFI